MKTSRTRVIQGLIAFGAMWELICYALRALNHTLIYRADLFFAQFAINQAAPFLFYGAIHNALDNVMSPQTSTFRLMPKPKFYIWALSAYNVAVAIIVIVGASLLGHGYARVATDMEQGSVDFVLAGNVVLRTGAGNKLAMLSINQAVITWLIIRTRRQRSSEGPTPDLKWLAVLFLTTGMMWTRTVFTLVEACQGVFGKAWSTETLFAIFEFATVSVAVTIWGVYRIGRVPEKRVDQGRKRSTDTTV